MQIFNINLSINYKKITKKNEVANKQTIIGDKINTTQRKRQTLFNT